MSPCQHHDLGQASKGGAVKGKQLLFVHGSGGNADSWYYQTHGLAGSDALTLPGHAHGNPAWQSPVPVPPEVCATVACNATYLADYITARGYAAGSVVAVGHSLGGAVVMQHALERPEQLAGIVLVGTGARLRVLPQLLADLRDDYPAAVAFLLRSYFGKGDDPALVEGSRRKLLRFPPDVVLADFTACNAFDLTAAVSQISLPTLLLFGSSDPLTPVKYGERLQAQIARSQLALIESEGHMFPLTQPTEFNRLVARFVEELAGD